jgi:hypothetical protein
MICGQPAYLFAEDFNRAIGKNSTESVVVTPLVLMKDQFALFGRDPNANHRCWVRRLYKSGLISAMPNEWKVAKDVENY